MSNSTVNQETPIDEHIEISNNLEDMEGKKHVYVILEDNEPSRDIVLNRILSSAISEGKLNEVGIVTLGEATVYLDGDENKDSRNIINGNKNLVQLDATQNNWQAIQQFIVKLANSGEDIHLILDHDLSGFNVILGEGSTTGKDFLRGITSRIDVKKNSLEIFLATNHGVAADYNGQGVPYRQIALAHGIAFDRGNKSDIQNYVRKSLEDQPEA